MEKLVLRHEAITNALKSLATTIDRMENERYNNYEECRDSLIQRFEYCADTFWKYLRDFVRVKFNIEIELARPKAVFKECSEINLISQQELSALINLIEDRNLTSHGYNENIAESIGSRISTHYGTMFNIINRLDLSNITQ